MAGCTLGNSARAPLLLNFSWPLRARLKDWEVEPAALPSTLAV